MPPGLTTPQSRFWRKLVSLRGPTLLGSAGFVKGMSKAGLSHQEYPPGGEALSAGGTGAAPAPSPQLLLVVLRPPRAQMLQVTEPAARRQLEPLGKLGPAQNAIRSPNSTVLLVPS